MCSGLFRHHVQISFSIKNKTLFEKRFIGTEVFKLQNILWVVARTLLVAFTILISWNVDVKWHETKSQLLISVIIIRLFYNKKMRKKVFYKGFRGTSVCMCMCVCVLSLIVSPSTPQQKHHQHKAKVRRGGNLLNTVYRDLVHVCECVRGWIYLSRETPIHNQHYIHVHEQSSRL